MKKRQNITSQPAAPYAGTGTEVVDSLTIERAAEIGVQRLTWVAEWHGRRDRLRHRQIADFIQLRARQIAANDNAERRVAA